VFITQVASSAVSCVWCVVVVGSLDGLRDDNDSCLSPVREDGECLKYVAACLA
jgi:hypothetical protein